MKLLRATVRQCTWRAPRRGIVSVGEVDHCITDPPYSERVHTKGRARAKGGTLGFEHITPEERRELARVLAARVRRWSLVFSDLEGAGDWCDAMRDEYLEPVRVGIWDKVDAAPQMSGDRPSHAVEAIVIGHRMHGGRRPRPMAKRWNGGGKRARWPASRCRDSKHPTQKPLRLMEALVADFTDRGETIIDPYAGLGTTLIAAMRLGRLAIGWERQAKWARQARTRITAETKHQTPLF